MTSANLKQDRHVVRTGSHCGGLKSHPQKCDKMQSTSGKNWNTECTKDLVNEKHENFDSRLQGSSEWRVRDRVSCGQNVEQFQL